jgi:DNA (cytosine-5)-methyltransferase 1
MSVAIVDLFAGAGGLGIGAIQAGAELRLSVEIDPIACQTLRDNVGFHPRDSVVELDISSLGGARLRSMARLSRRDPLVIIGGPPCQPFSKAAYWTDPGADARFRRARARGEITERPKPIDVAKADDRRDLVHEFMRIVFESDAVGFLFENVPSITHPRNKHIIPSLIRLAESQGFKCASFKVNAAEFGVPQRRERVFLIGSKGLSPVAPHPTHSLKQDPELGPFRPAKTAGQTFAELQIAQCIEPEEVVQGRWANELKEVPAGWNYKALSSWANHPNPRFEAETRFWNFLLKLHPDQPSWTLAATPGPWTGPFHWDNRRLRTVEMAALQSFPPEYVFSGSRRERVKQIGNAVPPLLARCVISELLAALGSNGSIKRARRVA